MKLLKHAPLCGPLLIIYSQWKRSHRIQHNHTQAEQCPPPRTTIMPTNSIIVWFLPWPRSNPLEPLEEEPPQQERWYHWPPVHHKQSCFNIFKQKLVKSLKWHTLRYSQELNFILDDISQLVEALWYKNSSISQSLVLSHCCFRGLVGTSSCMTKLNLKMAVLHNDHKTHNTQKRRVFSTENKPLRQTWWHRFQCTSTPQACWSYPL